MRIELTVLIFCHDLLTNLIYQLMDVFIFGNIFPEDRAFVAVTVTIRKKSSSFSNWIGI